MVQGLELDCILRRLSWCELEAHPGPRPTEISADEVKSMLADTKEAPVSASVGFRAWGGIPSWRVPVFGLGAEREALGFGVNATLTKVNPRQTRTSTSKIPN